MIDVEVRGNVAVLTLRRPEARNAVNPELAAALDRALDDAEADPAVRAVVLAAATTEPNPVFCAGADLKAVASGGSTGIFTRNGFAGVTHRDRDTPLIAAVDGLATAGGLEILLACDLIVASTRSSFGLAEVKRNLVANAGGCYRLPRAIGRAVALEMILTGNTIDAARAHALGMVNHVVEPERVVPLAVELAETIAANAPMAVAASRRIAVAADQLDDRELMAMGNAAMARIMTSDDLREGLAAFAQKRPPRWTGR